MLPFVASPRHRAGAATLAAALALVVSLSSCTTPPSLSSGPSGTADGVAPAQLRDDPPSAQTSAVPGLSVDALTENDPHRPVYASWPIIPGAAALNTLVEQTVRGEVAAFARDDPANPQLTAPPEYNGSWELAAANASVVGVRLMEYQFAGASGASSTATIWSDLSSDVAQPSAGLLAGPAAVDGVATAVQERLKAEGVDVYSDGVDVQDLVSSLTFNPAGTLIVTIDEGVISAYSNGVLTVPVDGAELSPLGRSVRAAIMSGTPFAAPVTAASSPAGTANSPVAPAPVDCRKAKCIALTFDDGPGPYTRTLLAELTAAQVRATFFLIGANVAADPSTVAATARADMVIGNHTWDHRDLTHLSASDIRAEITRTNTAIANAGGGTPTLFRPPYGAQNSDVRAGVGMPLIMWSVDTEDWKNRSVSVTTDRALDGARSGAIILMHDIHQSTVQAVPSIIAGLRARGYTLVTVPQLLGNSLQAGSLYFSG